MTRPARSPRSSRAVPAVIPRRAVDIAAAAARCRQLVRRRAVLSASAAVVPLPGLDVAVDVALLIRMLEEINASFGLSAAQLEQLQPRQRLSVYRAIRAAGGNTVGRRLTRLIVLRLLKRLTARVVSKSLLRTVPLAGQLVAASLSYGLIKLIGERHITDCVEVAERVAHLARARPARVDRDDGP